MSREMWFLMNSSAPSFGLSPIDRIDPELSPHHTTIVVPGGDVWGIL